MTIFSTNPSNGKYSVSRSGVIVTNNEEIAERAKLLRTHAIQLHMMIWELGLYL